MHPGRVSLQRDRSPRPLELPRRTLRPRQLHDESRALAERALGPEGAAHELDQAFRQREAEARAFAAPFLLRIEPIEWREQPVYPVGRDARPRVGDRQTEPAVRRGLPRDTRGAPLAVVLDGIREEVQ